MISPANAFMEYELLQTDAAMHAVLGHGIIHTTGPDALTYLQSVLSQDLDPLQSGQGAHALLLQPQGKLDADLRVLVVAPDDIWIDCVDAQRAMASLLRFKIRVDVTFEDMSASDALLAIRGPRTNAAVQDAMGITVPEEPYAFLTIGGCRWVRSAWPGGTGVDVMGPRADVESAAEALALPRVGVPAYERLRIAGGVPRAGIDMDDKTIPQEALLERDAISFTKGCFLGQELVCRIDSRGHVNRLLRIVTLAAPVAVGASVHAGGTEVGSVTSVAPTPTGAIALALVRREVEPGASVEVGERQIAGEVFAVPS